jgi:hypothetical protein
MWREIQKLNWVHLQGVILEARVIRTQEQGAGVGPGGWTGRPGYRGEAWIVPCGHSVLVPPSEDEYTSLPLLREVRFHIQFFPFQKVGDSA